MVFRTGLIICALLLSQTVNVLILRKDTAVRSGAPVRCCCEVSQCPCGCNPVPRKASESQAPPAQVCQCHDQPLPAPETNRVQVERLLKVGLAVMPVGTMRGAVVNEALAVGPTAHSPPPNIGLVKTFIVLI